MTIRVVGDAEPRADAREEQRRGEQHDGQRVVVGPLDESARALGGTRRPAPRDGRPRVAASLYCGMANGDSGALGIRPRPGGDPRLERRLELGAKAPAVEVGELGLVARVGVHPLREQRDVDLRLPVRHVRRARRLDASGDRCALGLGLLAVPARRLVGRPCGRHRRHREQHGRRELEVAVEAALVASSVRTTTASAPGVARQRSLSFSDGARACPGSAATAPSRPV